VELKSGTPEAAIAFSMELKHYFALTSQGKSKFRRALELAQGE
jgi:inorganic triphosphatase YgiF